MVSILLIQFLIEVFVALLGIGHDVGTAVGCVEWYSERILLGQFPEWMAYIGNMPALFDADGVCPV